MKRPLHAALLATAFLVSGRPAVALPVLVVDLERAIRGEASASAQGVSDFDSVDSASTESGALFAYDRPSAEAAWNVLAFAIPSYDSVVSAEEIAGVGNVESSAVAHPADAFAMASGEVLHRIVFQVTRDVILQLDGRVEAFGVQPGDALALVELSSVDSVVDPLLVSFEATPEDPEESFALAVALHPGVSYRLLAIARTQADALASPDSSGFAAIFRFALTEVPEPGTGLAVWLGLVALGARVDRKSQARYSK